MKDLSWKTISKEYIFKDEWIRMRRDSCETPEGKLISPYYVYEFPDWAIAVAMTTDGRFILERQYRHALGLTSYELPGGCVDPGDVSPEAAVRRELREETGYTFSSVEFLGKTSANPSTFSNWAYLYLATGGERTHPQDLDHGEDIEVQLFTIDELRQLLQQGGIVQSMHVTALFYALPRLGF